MNYPSEEQMNIINAAKEGYNIQVDAVAGSGKTTTVLSLAHFLNEKEILQVTYNSELRLEVRTKQTKYIKEHDMKLEKLSIYTYHALGVRYYTDLAKKDIGLNKIVEENMSPNKRLPNINIIVIDEIQDMNELYFRFIIKFLNDVYIQGDQKKNIQIITLGDKYQGLYDFKGADTRYLTYSYRIWKLFLSPYPFKIMKLTTSYRITRQIATFINNVMLDEERLVAVKDGPNVQFIRHPDSFQSFKIIGFRLISMILSGYAKPDDIFVLAPSVKSENSPVRLIENMLVNQNIPCYVPMSETSSISSEIIKNKVIFSSFHQSKGRERKIVVIYGFDDTYFAYFNRDVPVNLCPSTLYVATTRATELLILVECSKPLPFLKYSHQELMLSHSFVDFMGDAVNVVMNESTTMRPKSPEIIRRTSPTDLIKFLDENVLIKVVDLIEKDSGLFDDDLTSFPFQEVKIASVVTSNYHTFDLSEEVYDINGLAIPALFEERTSKDGSNSIKRYVKKALGPGLGLVDSSQKIHQYVLRNVELDIRTTLENHLKIVNVYISLREKLNFKVAQIKNYNWLSELEVNKILMNMSRHIKHSEDLKYEVEIINKKDDTRHVNIDYFVKEHMKHDERIGKLRFTGIIDAMSDEIIWEFKCVEELEPEHLIQVIIYAWIWKMCCETEFGRRVFKIMNIRTAEVLVLQYNTDAEATTIDQIMVLLLRAKYSKLIIKSDDEFVNKCVSYC
jgi:hypothetical protein